MAIPFVALLDGVAMRTVHVADRDNLIRAGLVGRVKKAVHAAAGADHPDLQSVIGSQSAGRGESRERASNQKTAAIEHWSHGSPIHFKGI